MAVWRYILGPCDHARLGLEAPSALTSSIAVLAPSMLMLLFVCLGPELALQLCWF